MLGGMVRHPLVATFVSFAGGMILSILSILIVRPVFPSVSQWAAMPWYVYTGGAFGFIFVTAVLTILPRTGVLLLGTGLIVGQLLFASMIDHFGWFGVPLRPFTVFRLIGVSFLLTGLLFIHKSS
jgi:transporter family-2 protein